MLGGGGARGVGGAGRVQKWSLPDGEPKQGIPHPLAEDCGCGADRRFQAYYIIELYLFDYRQGVGQLTARTPGDFDKPIPVGFHTGSRDDGHRHTCTRDRSGLALIGDHRIHVEGRFCESLRLP